MIKVPQTIKELGDIMESLIQKAGRSDYITLKVELHRQGPRPFWSLVLLQETPDGISYGYTRLASGHAPDKIEEALATLVKGLNEQSE